MEDCDQPARKNAFARLARVFTRSFVGWVAVSIFGMGPARAADSAPAMLTPGQFAVSPTGAFNYKVPIAIPPGTAGMEPDLSLDYSSQSGDGTVGWGWMLSGLPSIGRCPRTIAQDGVHGSVNFDANDRFCLNGQRLVAISGTYGADGTIYRTELEGFSQVVSHGTAGTGPSYFTVQTKAGQTMEFGNTTNSKVLATGTTNVRVWAVDKITDSKSNYLTATYTNDTTNGQAYPVEIDYTGNSNSGLSPFNSVKLIYNTSRLYPVAAYQAGSLTKTTVLLTDIQTFTGVGGGATLVSDYRLAYTPPSSGAAHYELTSVTQCDAVTGGSCLKPTSFGWQGSKDTLTLTATANGIAQSGSLTPGYFQGSGLTDLLTSSATPTCGIWFGSPTGFTYSSMNVSYQQWYSEEGTYYNAPYTGPPCGTAGVYGRKRYVDFNGDGLTDLFLTQTVSAGHQETFQLANDGTQLKQSFWSPGSGAPINPAASFVGDFNGDGRTDIVNLITNYQIQYSNGDGSFTYGPTFTSSSANILIADFDGNGCDDVFIVPSNSVQLSCNGAVSSYTPPTLPAGEVTYGDFNGDGLVDILVAPVSGAATLYLSTGKGTATAITLSGFTDWGKYAIYTGDWNGDGKTDLLLVAAGSSGGGYGVGTTHKFFLSTGANFIAGPTIANTNSMDTTVSAVIADWNNDGAQDVWLKKPSGDAEELFSYVPEAIATVTNGLGVTTTVTYDRINKNSPLYQKCATAGVYACGTAYPTQSLDGPLYVVSTLTSANGIGGTYSSSYAYQGAQSDLQGRGFLGFSQMTITDNQTGVVHSTTYGTVFPYSGLTMGQLVTSGSQTLSSSVNTYGQVSLGTGTEGVARSVVELHKTVVTSNDLDGSALPTVTTTYTYDCDSGSACSGTSPTGFGNTTVVAVSVSDGSSKTTTSTYANDTAYGHWYLGRLLTANVQSIVGSSNLTRQTSYTYDTGASSSTGLLTSEIVEPESSSDPTLKLETDYGYDAFGNKTSSSSVGCTFGPTCTATTRATTSLFDTTTYHGQFATQVTNALSESETWSYMGGVAFGTATSHTGPNGLTTTWAYDTFGRKTLETRPDGNKTALAYVYCTTSSCPTLPTGLTAAQLPANVQFYVLTTPETSGGAQNGPLSVTFYDGLSRALATDVEGFDGTGTGCTASAPCWIRAATQYDANGRVQQSSRPYFVATGTPKWTVNSYDVLGRATLVTFPDSSTLATRFCGLTTPVTNALGQIKTSTNNAQGKVAQVYELATATCNTSGNLTSYTYDAFGDPLTVVDPASNTVANNTYDIRGRRTKSIDADMHTWTYMYDGFGELYAQTDAKSQVSTFSYDSLGRVTAKAESGFVSYYTYDTASGKGVGQPATATTGTGNSWGGFNWGAATWTGSAYTRTFAYDTLGRPSGLTLNEDGTAGAYALTYDANGRLLTAAYPSGLTLKYTYTTLGYLQKITDNATSAAYWTANARDAEMHLTSAVAGSGVTTTQAFDPNTGLVQSILAGTGSSASNQAFSFDTLGRLTSRSWLNTTGGVVKENSCFDGLNRLTSTLITSGTACTGTGAVTMTYDALGNITSKSDICATAGCFAYGGSGAGPHALTSVTGVVNGVTNPTFAYDANGTMTSGAGRTIAPTMFNMAASMTSGANTVWFGYDPDHARYKMVSSGLNAGTTYYLNDDASGAMEEREVVAGVTTWRDYIMADGKLIAQRQCVGPPPCSSGASMLYFILDHLGSVTVVTDGSGAVLQRLSYDAWGKRRNADGTALSCTGGLAQPNGVSRGFTGQEMIDALCLVNLNARVYDPTLGRFMSADPVVGDATVPQELNRFSYVLNDPLSLTDPSGLCFLGCFWKSAIFRDVLAIAVAVLLEQPEVVGWWSGTLVDIGFESVSYTGASLAAFGFAGGVSGLISSGGSLKGAALGALEADLFFEAGNVLQDAPKGGYLGLGAKADAFVSHGLVGGLTSEVRGGNFGSGFLSAGIGTLTPVPTGKLNFEQTLLGTTESAALGGVGSTLGGDKFQNGAITGAFGYLFNDAAHGDSRHYDPRDPNYHAYPLLDPICSVSADLCTPAEVFEALRSSAAPGQTFPAYTGDRVNVIFAGPITQFVYPDILSIYNVTLTGHWFDPGYVERSVIQIGDTVYVRTEGEGTGQNRWLNMLTARPAFELLDSVIRMQVLDSHNNNIPQWKSH
jgi:RHS repeat-associated protein